MGTSTMGAVTKLGEGEMKETTEPEAEEEESECNLRELDRKNKSRLYSNVKSKIDSRGSAPVRGHKVQNWGGLGEKVEPQLLGQVRNLCKSCGQYRTCEQVGESGSCRESSNLLL